MSEYLNKDMVEALGAIGASDADKAVVKQILMLEKRHRNNLAAKDDIVDICITLVAKNYANDTEQTI